MLLLCPWKWTLPFWRRWRAQLYRTVRLDVAGVLSEWAWWACEQWQPNNSKLNIEFGLGPWAWWVNRNLGQAEKRNEWARKKRKRKKMGHGPKGEKKSKGPLGFDQICWPRPKPDLTHWPVQTPIQFGPQLFISPNLIGFHCSILIY